MSANKRAKMHHDQAERRPNEDDAALCSVHNHQPASPHHQQPINNSSFVFGHALPAVPVEIGREILSYLSIRDVFHCYQTNNRSWRDISKSAMESISQSTQERFACKCVAVYPKILGKYIDLENATRISGDYGFTPFDVRMLEHLPSLKCYCNPDVDVGNHGVQQQKITGYIMRQLGTHCVGLEECDLGHQIWDDEFTTADVSTLLEGCPLLHSLESQNGFRIFSWRESTLLSALRNGKYEQLTVPIGLHRPRHDMDTVIGGFVDDPGKFQGTLTTFPYCWNEDELPESDLEEISKQFNAKSEALMERAQQKGFCLYIDDMDWYP